MKRLILLFLVVTTFVGRTDEGMFMPMTLKKNYKAMKKAGLDISYKDIYSTKKPSIKDAIVSLGGFCTAEIISPQGLILTNHHCGYDAIREKSTPENDYLTDGFWAMNNNEELPIEGLTVSVVVEIIDVTDEVLDQLKENMGPDERSLQINRISKMLAQDKVSGTHYSAEVKEFYKGSEYYLYVYEVFQDVRLVGAPPSSIGKYGGDTDNWMWTRHTGDFSMFRIYANKANKPAPFSMDNQPYQPKHHLPVSIKGIEENDFTMILGFPGSTDRYLTSYGVKMAVEKDQPTRVKIRGKKLEIMKEEMNKSDEVRIQYASTYAQVSNYWKYFIGQSEQLKNNSVYEKKKKIEKDFQKWVDDKSKRQERYGSVLKDMEEAYDVISRVNPTNVYFTEAVYSIHFNRFVTSHTRLYMLLQEDDLNEQAIKKEAERLANRHSEFFENFDYTTERRVVSAMLKMYSENVPDDQVPEILLGVKDDDMNWSDWVSKGMENSVFTDEARYEEFIQNPTKALIDEEPLLSLGMGLLNHFRSVAYSPTVNTAHNKLKEAGRLFIEALREMYPKKDFYPDANFSLRLSYGNVLPYTTPEGKEYKYYTTIDGLMAKEDPSNDEFIVPDKLKTLYEKKDYGRYAAEDGNMWVNFISNNDITGGNSGSPVINGNGELIGCAFDGNWEAMSGDIFFEDELQRTISCDIRYILFIIEKYAGADHLIEEMTIVS